MTLGLITRELSRRASRHAAILTIVTQGVDDACVDAIALTPGAASSLPQSPIALEYCEGISNDKSKQFAWIA